MTREETLAEINRLKEELQKVNDNINDARDSLRWAIKEDEKERKELFRKRSKGFAAPIGEGINYADCQREVRIQKTLEEYQNKRIQLKTQIEELKEQLHSKSTDLRTVGVVKWYNPTKEFGFITVDGQPDVWVHKSALRESSALEQGDKVTFKRVQGPKGFKAVDVRYVAE